MSVLLLLYVLIKDRIGILRSLKPKSIFHFFCINKERHLDFGIIFGIILNSFALLVWVPFWIFDKIFNLGIFQNKK